MARGRSSEPDPERVAAGTERATLHELVTLIDRVNPTARGLSAREEARRYALKSKLQSRLIREHPGEIRVHAVDDDTVALELVTTGRHAAHARLSSLDPAERAWVQLQLDTPSEPAPVARPASNPSRSPARERARPSDPLAAASAALEAYDYPAARELYELAARERPVEALPPLLELLVDYLGDDHAALSLAAGAPDAVARRPDVRLRIATAALRSGERARAASALDELEGAEASALWCKLGAAAAADGQLDEANRAMRRATAARPEDLDAIRSAIAELVRSRREPEERDLLARVAAGEPDEVVERAARDLLARHGESPVARRIAAAIEVRRRDDGARSRSTRARERAALATAGDLEEAVALAREASALRADPALDAEAVTWAARAAALRHEERVSSILEHVRAGAGHAPLLEYAGAPEGVRASVRAAACAPELDVLEQLLALRGVTEQAAVAAVLTTRQARALAEIDPDRGLELVSALSPRIGSHRSVASIRSELARRAGERAATRTAIAIAEAEQALDRGDHGAALASLQGIPSAPTSLEPRAVELVARAEKMRAIADAVTELERAEVDGDAFAALRAARTAAALDPSRSSLLECAEQRLASQLRWRVAETPVPREDVFFFEPDPRPWLRDAGRRLVVPRAFGRWCFLRIVDERYESRAISFRAPVPMTGVELLATDERVTLVSGRGDVIVLDASSGRPRELVSLAGLVAAEQLIDGQLLAADGDFLIQTVRVGNDTRMRVIDVRERCVRRELGEANLVAHVGGEPARIVRLLDGRLSVHDESGRRAAPDIAIPGSPCAVAACDGDLIVLTSTDPDFGPTSAADVQIVTPEGRVGPALRIPDASAVRPSALVGIEGGGACIYTREDGRRRLTAFRRAGAALEPVWSIEVPRNAFFAVDSAGRHARLVAGHESIRISLGTRPFLGPADYGQTAVAPWHRVAFRGFGGEREERVQRAAMDLALLPRSGRPAAARARAGAGSEAAVEVASALTRLGDWQLSLEVLDEAIAREPGHMLARYLRAEADVWRGRAAIVRAELEVLRSEDARVAQAIASSLGLARYFSGDVEGALAAWRRASGHDAAPEVAEAIAFVEATHQGRGGAADHVARTREAGERLASGQPRGAISALECRETWQREEPQSLARMAAAWLAIDVEGDAGDRFRKTFALAAFVATHEDFRGEARTIAIPGDHWPAERLAGIADEARRWLEG